MRAMRVLLQRVERASVTVDGREVAAVGRGFLALIGVGPDDAPSTAVTLAGKVAALRVFDDGQGHMNLSLRETGGALLAVSQFTLYADTRRGNRPSFSGAAPPALAEELYEAFVAALRAVGVPVATGVFGAHMRVALVNDGPVTILLEG